ncbi:hypothetical protein [Dankookia sp. P2]|uniref:hypothetical protein n=1 Tax=Dankookia sp. P2 TaxID=3423955 RepID=UPI003D677F2D
MLPAAAAAGFAAVGVTAVTLSVTREIAGVQATGLWLRCNLTFAVVQTVAGFGLAAVFAATGESHLAVFGAGFGFSLAGFGTGGGAGPAGRPAAGRRQPALVLSGTTQGVDFRLDKSASGE